jgi:hypothetical protein
VTHVTDALLKQKLIEWLTKTGDNATGVVKMAQFVEPVEDTITNKTWLMFPAAPPTRMEEMQLVNICRENQTKHNMDCPKKYSCVHTVTLSAADGAKCWGN